MTEKDYQDTINTIETYLQKGSMHLTEVEKEELLSLSLRAEAYEQTVYPMPIPSKR